MAWLILLVAGCFEVGWTYFMKSSEGFTKIIPSLLFLVSLAASMLLLGIASRSLPLSLAYPVWTGIGAVGAVIVGVVVFRENLNFYSLFFVSLIVVGILGLKVVHT